MQEEKGHREKQVRRPREGKGRDWSDTATNERTPVATRSRKKKQGRILSQSRQREYGSADPLILDFSSP